MLGLRAVRARRPIILVASLALLCAALVGVALAGSERWSIEQGTGTSFTRTTALIAGDVAAASVAASNEAFPDGAATALIARDDLFADTLASGAAQTNTPLLLTDGAALDPIVADELRRLGVDHVTILGGESAVTPAVADQLRGIAGRVDRIGGATRIETSIDVARMTAPGAKRVLLVRGFGPDPSSTAADSLSAGAAAARIGAPILLTPTDEVHPATRAYLAEGAEEVVIIGGTVAISTEVEQELRAAGLRVRRVSGPDRFATAVAVAAQLLDAPRSAGAPHVIVAEGVSDLAWASGLPAAALASQRGAPVVLTAPGVVPRATATWIADGGDELVCAAFVAPADCRALASPPPVTLTGEVFDGIAGGPVPGAAIDVQIRDTVLRTQAGPDGAFSIASVPVGNGTVRATADGYRARTVPVRTVSGTDHHVVVGMIRVDAVGDPVLPPPLPGPGDPLPPQPPPPVDPTPPPGDPDPSPEGPVLLSGAEGLPLFDEGGLVPGSQHQRVVTISNDGAPAEVRLMVTAGGDLASALQVVVEEEVPGSGYVQRFSGSLAQLGAQHGMFHDGLGDWFADVDEQRRYRFTTTLPAGAGNQLQGSGATADLIWEGRS